MDMKLMRWFLTSAAIAIVTTLSLWSRRSRSSREDSERTSNSDDIEEENQVSPPPSSPSPPVREDGFQYDVFLSFRGPDTRKTFTDILYEALKDKGVASFIDSEKLEKGQKVEELFQCIQRSKIFVPIFSKGYADSEWCLKEIAEMVECKRLIVPVFIDVEPTDVRRQTGPFAPAFKRHHRNKTDKEVSKWCGALKEAGKVSGYTLATTDGYEGKLIQAIVKRILIEVNKTPLFAAKHPVGLDSRMAELMEVLDLEAHEGAKIVGIHAMGGMGKTTLANAVYNKISSGFEACSLISNVREMAKQSLGLVSLQKQLLKDVFKDENTDISSTEDGIGKIKKRIGAKKVLVVLDDVDNKSQLDALAGSVGWFHSGSRIIITTRNKQVLGEPRVKKNEVYELKELDATQSVQLFSWHAFGKEEPDAQFVGLSKEVASTADGLPLALVIFGSLFFDLKTVDKWNVMLERLKEDQHKEVHERLRISFDALDEIEKQVFLDIACFFIGKRGIFYEMWQSHIYHEIQREHATLVWEACKFFPDLTIEVLKYKSLVNINDETGDFEMHDHIRDMGREIVKAESKEVGKRSRLWKEYDIETLDVLQNKRGGNDIEAIRLSYKGVDSVYVDAESFEAMCRLRILWLGENVRLKGEYAHFPRMLKWLEWPGQDLDSLPGSLPLENIVVLDLSKSSITQLWDQQEYVRSKVFNKLKVLRLSGCGNLRVCPDFTSMPHLERLGLNGCWRMTELHPSIGHLKSLTHLDLGDCTLLQKLPREVWQLTSLQELKLSGFTKITALPLQLGDSKSSNPPLLDNLKVLDLSFCWNLTNCPDFTSMPHLEILEFQGCYEMSELHPSIGHLQSSLTRLSVSGCMSELPPELWQLTSLERLHLQHCIGITCLPSQLGHWNSLDQPLHGKLKFLTLGDCRNLTTCPDLGSMPHLEKLVFDGCVKMSDLHPSVSHLKGLTHLSLERCESLKKLPEEVGYLASLEFLNLFCCLQITDLPSQMGDLKSLKHLCLGSTSITTIPEWIGSLLNLEQLNANNCELLATLPDSLGNLRRLRSLSLRGTAIEELPGSTVSLEKLEVLLLVGCKRLKFLPASTSMKSRNVSSASSNEGPSERQRYSDLLLQFQPSLIKLHALGCYELEMIADVSNAQGLIELDLRGCQKLVDVPGIEQLTNLEILNLMGCRSLDYDIMRTRLKEANFPNLRLFTISGSLGETSDARYLSIFLPKSLDYGLLCLKVEECGLDHIAVHVDIGMDDGQLLSPISISAARLWRPNDPLDPKLMPTVKLEEYGETVVAAGGGKPMTMTMMRVCIDGCLLLDGYFEKDSTTLLTFTFTKCWEKFGGPRKQDGPIVLLHVTS